MKAVAVDDRLQRTIVELTRAAEDAADLAGHERGVFTLMILAAITAMTCQRFKMGTDLAFAMMRNAVATGQVEAVDLGKAAKS